MGITRFAEMRETALAKELTILKTMHDHYMKY
jgi:hypothetical protein